MEDLILTSMCFLQLEMYVKYMTMIIFPGTDSWFKMKHASSEVCCETPSFINISDCHFDLLMMHVTVYMFVIYLQHDFVYLNIYRCWIENLQSSTQILKQNEPCHWELHIYIYIYIYILIIELSEWKTE